MILACPSCGARFDVEAAHLGREGRRVRCGRCAHQWRAYPEDAVPAAPPIPTSGSETAARLDADERRSAADMAARVDALGTFGETPPDGGARAAARSRLGHSVNQSKGEREDGSQGSRRGAAGWVALLLVFLALVAGLWLARERIVALVPEAAAVYAAIGVEVPLDPTRTLDLEVEQPQRIQRDGQSLLIVSGTLRNRLAIAQDLPGLDVRLLNAEGEEVLRVPAELEALRLEPGGETVFQAEIADPPAEASEINLVFAQ